MPDEGWWIGICRGKRGIFPKAYIELQAADKVDLGKCGTALYDYDAGILYFRILLIFFIFGFSSVDQF